MPKQKTHKATKKRISLTKTGKIKQRKAGQNHFNSKESGKVKRNKRRDITQSRANIKRIREALLTG
jgi:large subunit ribosomal protein L35